MRTTRTVRLTLDTLSLRAFRFQEPLAHSPLVFVQQHPAQFGKHVGPRIVESPQDALPVLIVSANPSVESQCLLEKGARWLVDQPDDLAHVVVGDKHAREIHRSEPTRELVGDH